MFVDEIIALIIIIIFSFSITVILKEPLTITLLLMSMITGLLYAFRLVPYYFLIVALMLLAYSVYRILWGSNEA
jgi:hypothetical protein